MAKQANTYAKAPWYMKPAELQKFTQVTPENFQNAKVVGRVFYSIIVEGKLIQYCGSFFLTPPDLQKGYLKIEGHPFINFANDIFVDDQQMESYMQYKKVFDWLMERKRLYIKINDPIIKFYRR